MGSMLGDLLLASCQRQENPPTTIMKTFTICGVLLLIALVGAEDVLEAMKRSNNNNNNNNNNANNNNNNNNNNNMFHWMKVNYCYGCRKDCLFECMKQCNEYKGD